MRRTLALITILLLVGAIANIAVAWGCARWSPLDKGIGPRPLTADAQAWVKRAKYEPVRPPLVATWFKGIGCRVDGFVEIGNQSEGLFRVRAGWPYLALSGGLNASFPRFEVPGFVVDALVLPGADPVVMCNDHRLLPLRPIWTGFLINTFVYVAILWIMFIAPGQTRRAIRRHRNLCPACAYPIGSSPVCTECGTPVRRSR